jgi:hypothetical protein
MGEGELTIAAVPILMRKPLESLTCMAHSYIRSCQEREAEGCDPWRYQCPLCQVVIDDPRERSGAVPSGQLDRGGGSCAWPLRDPQQIHDPRERSGGEHCGAARGAGSGESQLAQHGRR